MSTPRPLPDAALLEKLLLGQLPPAEAEALCSQLQDSEQFAVLAQSLIASDTLIEALHAQTTHPTPRPDARLEGLMARLSKLRPDLSGVDVERTAADVPAGAAPITFLSPARQPDEMGRLGEYRVLKVLGQGGMGVVFLAEDTRLGRRVALKTMRPEAAQMANAKQRFLREARGTAAIEHDHIIPIFQVGEENGVPYLAMPLLRGEPLDERLKRAGGSPLPVREIVRIGREIAEGLAAAHEQGLIHRDIKPANVWLEGERGRVKVLDFGLARAAGENTNLTQSGAIVGTPAYMAPEQARGEAIDARCDLFSLGCLLYQMCTGQRPFNGPDTMSILMSLALDQPAPPRQRNAELPAELSDLITRLLAKKPQDRPESARAVADALAAIERGLSDDRTMSLGRQPIPAAAPARTRRRLAVAVAAALLLTGGLIAAVVIIRNKTGKEVARINVPEDGSVEVKPDDKGKPPEDGKKQATAIPADPLPKIEPRTPLGPLALVTNPAPLHGVRSWTIETRMPRGALNAVAYRPDGRLVATAGEDGVIRLLEPQSGRLLHVLVGHTYRISRLAWSPDGRTLASGSQDGTVRLWDADSGRHLRKLTFGFIVDSLFWFPDGRTLAASRDNITHTWDVVSGELVRDQRWSEGAVPLALSPDGKQFAGRAGKKVRIWEAESGREVRTLPVLIEVALHLCWSPDGRRMASTGGDHAVRLWDVETGKELWSRKAPLEQYVEMAWSHDGKTLAVHKAPSVVEFIRAEDGKLLTWIQNVGFVSEIAWSSDSGHFAVCTLEGNLWLMKSAKTLPNIIPPTAPGLPVGSLLTSLAWSPDGKQLAAATYGTGLRVVNPATGETSASLSDAGRIIAWSPSKWVAAAGLPAQLTLWQPGGGKRVLPAQKRGDVFALAWSPDGKTLADAGSDQDLRLWDGATGQAKATWNIGPAIPFPQTMTWSPDGKLLAVSIAEGPIGKVKVLHADTGKEQRSIPNFNSVAWSPVGETLALFNRPHANVQLLDAKTGEDTVKLSTVDSQVVAWSPDGKLLATACSGGEGSQSLIQVWDAATGEEVRKLDRVCLRGVAGMVWSPDGKRIAAGSGQTIQLWDAATGKTDGVIFHHPHFHGLTIRPDGQYRGNFKVAEEVVMVVQKEDGSTETLPPAEFARKYGRKQGDAPPESTPEKQPDKDKPFVLLRDNKEVRAFKTLFGAFNEMQSGDVVEVHGDGPFPLGLVRLQGKDLSLRAAPGYRPTFVPSRSLTQYGQAWFEIKDGALNIVGCDFHQPTNCIAFAGGGKPWDFHNCRIRNGGAAVGYAGPRLHVADSMLTGKLLLGPKVELELDNNILRQGEYNTIQLASPGGQTLHLRSNTIRCENRYTGGMLSLLDAKGVSVEATGNILLFSGAHRHLFSIQAKDGRDRVRWTGRQNLYAGLSAPIILWEDNIDKRQLLDLEGKPLAANAASSMPALLGRDEEGSRLTPADPQVDAWRSDGSMLFQRQQARLQDQAGIVRILRGATARLRQRPGLADVGPDWDVVGSGDAYVRALAAAGKPVAKEKLRPEAEEGGPFTLLRAGKVVRGYATLQEAINAAASGDIIDIRNDGPFAGGVVSADVELTIRAAPGYRAVVDGNVAIQKGTATLEGLHFRMGGPAISPKDGRLARLANCSFETRQNGGGFVVGVGKGKQTEVVNCLTLDMLGCVVDRDGKLIVRNSVAGYLSLVGDAQGNVDLDRCLLWGPTAKLFFWQGAGQPLGISARRTILEAGNGLLVDDVLGISRWNGSHNVYRVGSPEWTLDFWRKQWKSAEEGSVEDEPSIFDPRQWRLLPQSPGYHAGTNGKDLGADVDRIAVPTKPGEPARTK